MVSVALYLLTLRRGWSFHTCPDNQAWFFNPLAWQLLFVIGATCAYARAGTGQRLLPRPLTLAATIVAGAITLISLTWMAHWMYDPFPPIFLKLWYLTLDKTNHAPLRLFNCQALDGATKHFVQPDSRFLRSDAARPIILCGQNSLYVFCLGIVLSVLGHFVLSEINAGIGMQIAVNIVGLAMMVGTAALLQWFKMAGLRSSARPAPSE